LFVASSGCLLTFCLLRLVVGLIGFEWLVVAFEFYFKLL